MKKILITGATGFIGSKLACKLASLGSQVNALYRSISKTNIIKRNNIELYHGDLLDIQSLESAMKGCYQVYHLAAYAKNWSVDKKLFDRINIEGTKNILKAAQKYSVDKIVCTSTSVVFGPSNGRQINESQSINLHPYNDYDRTKILEEDIIDKFTQEGLNIVTIYPTRVFGPGVLNESNAVTQMIYKYFDGKWRLKLSDGNAVGNYVFIDDVVDGHINAMKYGQIGGKYIIGGDNISYNDFFRELGNIIGKNKMMVNIPARVALLYSKIEEEFANRFRRYPLITPGWVNMFLDNWAFSSDRAISEINYTITPLPIALKRTIEWIKQHKFENSQVNWIE